MNCRRVWGRCVHIIMRVWLCVSYSIKLQLVKPLLDLMNDEMVQVKDSAAWTIGRVCERCPGVLLNEQYLEPLLVSLLASLQGEPRVAVNACWVSKVRIASHTSWTSNVLIYLS